MEIGSSVAAIALVSLMSGLLLSLDNLIIGIGVAGLGTSSVGFILALVQ